MGLTREEQEIHINKDATENEFSVYTTDPIFIRKMKKIGIEPYQTEELDGEVVGYFYKVPKNQISFKKEPKKRELSDEQREELRLRAINMRNNKKSNNT